MTDAKKPKKIKMIIEESEEPPEPVQKELDDINEKLKTLQDLSTQSTVNMTDILNLHNTINTNIEKIENRIEKIKTEFNNTKHKPIKEIEPELYQKYIDEINSLSGEIDADTDIEELINIYKTATYKINLCENFLKSRQMNIVYCDNDTQDEE
jgi:hypothetical protein